jgi:1,4-alpha-glucan branching enzyme
MVQQDPWLAPYADALAERAYRYRGMRILIDEEGGSLRTFSSLYKELGLVRDKAKKGWWYREWAPSAAALHLTGDFNQWNRTSHPLTQRADRVWEIFVADGAQGIAHGQGYKVAVTGSQGTEDRIPAFANYVVQDDATKAYTPQVYHPEKPYQFQHRFTERRQNPLIYEAHVGMASEEERVATYREFAENVLPRILGLGYDTIQLMAIQEHPYYGSYGYHVSSLFAPSSRFGTPDDLKYLIDTAHGMGLAVIMDIVHSHAVKNRMEGLDHFDGSPDQYFHPGPRGEHEGWDSKLYNYGKAEVLQFLLSNVRYWLEEFQFDGYRFDGVTSMLYHHHGMGKDFVGYGDYFTEETDQDAVLYLQLASEVAHDAAPHAICVAEDMSGMPGLAQPLADGGIGFDFRLGMGIPDYWIRLIKEKQDEAWDVEAIYWQLMNRRKGEATIAYVESHDQALVGDQTVLFRLMGPNIYTDMGRSVASLVADRAVALHKMIRMITISVGGEGWLNFMGNEFGHPEWIDFPREGNAWSYRYARRQWNLADSDYLRYHGLNAFDKAMVAIIRQYNVLAAAPPRILNVDPQAQSLAFERAGLIFTFNFSPTESLADYAVWVPEPGKYINVLSSDETRFDGLGRAIPGTEHFTDEERRIRFYNCNRTAQVFAREA